MCLAVPAEIVELNDTEAVCEIGGVRRMANVAFVEDPEVGDYVLLHAGLAIRKWPSAELAEYRELIRAAAEEVR